MEGLFGIFVGVVYVGLFLGPLVLTAINIYKVLALKSDQTPIDIFTFIIGSILSFLLYMLSYDNASYDTSLVVGYLHEPIFMHSFLTILVFSLIGFISYLCLKFAVAEKKLTLPPLVMVIYISGVYLGIITSILIIIQLLSNIGNDEYVPFFLCLLPFNYIIYAFGILGMTSRIKTDEYEGREFKNVFLNKCNQLLADSWRWKIVAFVLFFPMLGILVMILALFGQEPDSMIKAFTYTSDWFFSTKTSPPPHDYDGHYLCTVAAGGHPKLVKPIRYGERGGQRIIVNRQLCVANAFEQIIEERTPRLHRKIRSFYDRYGLPVSRYIRTPLSADLIYIAMKPFEYLFLAVLYLFDSSPEERIARQYSPK